MASRNRPPARDDDRPFLFLGAGFATSRKSVWCQLWFERAPDMSEREAIEAHVPSPLLFDKRWNEELLELGTDDALELHVGDGKKRPTRAQWTSFCQRFEQSVRAVHHIVPLVLVCKNDDGAYGLSHSTWHTWTLERIASRFHELPRPPALQDSELLLPTVVDWITSSPPALRALTLESRRSLITAILGHLRRDVTEDDGNTLVEALLELHGSEPLDTELVQSLYPFASVELGKRLGSTTIVARTSQALRAASPEDIPHVLRLAVAWMLHLPPEGTLGIGELLASDIVAMAHLEKRAAQGGSEAAGASCPSSALAACASTWLETGASEEALRSLELAMRFPAPSAEIQGLMVRALVDCEEDERADALARSEFVQHEIGPRAPRTFYHIARAYLELGELDLALEQVGKYLLHDPQRAALLEYDTHLADLFDIPEFRRAVEEAIARVRAT